MKKVIGVSGYARSGKDSVCTILIREFAKMGYKAQRFALADELKNDLFDFIQDNFGIDIWNCTDEEKALIRPLMVAYGGAKRTQSKGTYWTSIVQQEYVDLMDDDEIIIVPDVRYCQYEKDEIDWLKDQGGVLVHISRMVDGDLLDAPNADERENDPKLQRQADFKIVWESFNDKNKETEEAKIVNLAKLIKEKWKL